MVQHPVKLKSEVECTSYGDCAKQVLQQIGLVDGEDDTVLLHQVEIDMEQVDVAGAEEENTGHSQGNTVKDNQENEIADGGPEIVHRLVLPVSILDIAKNIWVWSIVSSNEAEEIGKGDDDLKTFSKYKHLNHFSQVLNVFFSQIFLCFKSFDSQDEVDQEFNADKNVHEGHCSQAPNTDWQEYGVIGDS